MRTVYIMIEGPTEEEFVNNSLSQYLKGFGILNCIPIPVETSRGFSGGDVTFERYKKNAENLLTCDPICIVTSLIDYYELRKDFPGYETAKALDDKNESVAHIEQAISEAINNARLIPYIQLHEFEGILFSDITGFNYVPNAHIGRAQYVINHYPNPELINDTKETTPSARLCQIIPRYRKPLHGPIIAMENGINSVLARCPRFRNWTDLIIEKAVQP